MINGAITGRYEKMGQLSNADCVIGHSFGTSIEAGSPNAEIATIASSYAESKSLPLIVDETLAWAMTLKDQEPAVSVGGPVSNGFGVGVGTWGTFIEGKRFMDEHGLRNPIVIAQAFHIGRVAMQAKKLKMNPIVLEGMPAHFDTESEQLWTRSRALWIPREVVGLAVLKTQKRL